MTRPGAHVSPPLAHSTRAPTAKRREMHDHTIYMRRCYAETLYLDDSATLDDLREAVTTLEETERIARRVLGGAHPLTSDIEDNLQDARAALRARSASLE